MLGRIAAETGAPGATMARKGGPEHDRRTGRPGQARQITQPDRKIKIFKNVNYNPRVSMRIRAPFGLFFTALSE
jgi:hypothetical protein